MNIFLIKDKHPLIDLARYGTKSRKSIHPDLLIGEHPMPPLFKEGDILDANATFAIIQSATDNEHLVSEIVADHVSNNVLHVTEEDHRTLEDALVIYNLKLLAFKDDASAQYIPNGVNSDSEIILEGGETKNLSTTEITCVDGVDTIHDTPSLNTQGIGSASDWDSGQMFTVQYDDDNETLTFISGRKPSLVITSTQVGTSLTLGAEKIFAKAAEQRVTVATGLVQDGGNGDQIVTQLHTGGIAKGQTFTGTQATITVS